MKLSAPVDSFVIALGELKSRITQFAKTGGEKSPTGFEIHDPLFHTPLAKTEEEAAQLDITTEDGREAVLKLRRQDQRFKEWFIQQNR